MSGIPPFRTRLREALAHRELQEGLLAFQRSWRKSRDAQVGALEAMTGATFDELRQDLATMKDGVLDDLPGHVARFRQAAEASGAVVVEAADAAEANAYVARLCQERGTSTVVKGKSMVTEEIGLNDFLADAGITAVESDLGEWLLQLAGERPSHIVMPAIHQHRHRVAQLLGQALNREFDPDDIPAMVRGARTGLREAFMMAGVGVTGANALVASSGSVLLVTNEGNGELAASVPPVHVVVTGIEKVVPTMADAWSMVRLLARSATGQPITTYTSLFTGPAPGRELHIVLVDNGRSRMAADEVFRPALRCIRCGACSDVCPAYQVVGGHAFGHVYTGPIGLVNTAFHHSLADAAGPQSLCLTCGACETVCPAEIPLQRQILEVRRRVRAEARPSWWSLGIRASGSRRAVALGTRLAAVMTWPVRRGRSTRVPSARWLPFAGTTIERHIGWRTLPAFPWRPGHAEAALKAPSSPPGGSQDPRPVALFLQCIADRLAPEVPLATAMILRDLGRDVTVPSRQHCCGLPAIDAGDAATARRMARQTIEAFEREAPAHDIVIPAPSCARAIHHDYPRIFANDPDWRRRAVTLGNRTYDLAAYLSGSAETVTAHDARSGTVVDAPVVVDRFCQAQHLDGRGATVERLIADLAGIQVRPLPEAEVCCGFGGVTSFVAPEVSREVVRRKFENVQATGARCVVTDNPGCVLHLRGAAEAAGLGIEVLHLAEYLTGHMAAQRAGEVRTDAPS